MLTTQSDDYVGARVCSDRCASFELLQRKHASLFAILQSFKLDSTLTKEQRGALAMPSPETYRNAERHCMPHISSQPMASEGSRPNPKELGQVVLL